MKYLVLARRYRPQSFREVYGQEAVLTTLKNALRKNRVAHAYLFCGSRGVGKTTLARLFAKALNCSQLQADFEPCNKCPSCREILSGQSLDVIEIDGASNRGIDDIRQLNETVSYAPSHGNYKIYIIDEVHMLTKEAFNALLKTLEEPPARAKFFFATTEPHKVLPTILSRCQRFELRRLTESQISNKLLGIAHDLSREVSIDAVRLIAAFSEGSLRDAESLFDQILCFSDNDITTEHVRSVLGLMPDDIFFTFDTAFSEGRISYAFELVEDLFQRGKDLIHFAEQFINHYRRLSLAKALGVESLSLSEATSKQITASLKFYSQAQLLFILDLALTTFTLMQKSTMQRVSLEALLLQVLRSKNRIPIEILTRRLSELETHLLQAPPKEMLSESPSPSLLPPAPLREPQEVETTPTPLPLSLQTAPTNSNQAIPLAESQQEPNLADPLSKLAHSKPISSREENSHAPSPQKLPHERLDKAAAHQAATGPTLQSINLPKQNITSENSTETYPGRHTTLMRFAAVELEGTLKMEK